MFTTILRSFGSWGMGKLGALVTFSALGMLFGMLGRAQVSTATLNGTVTDNTGALIPGAKVMVVQTQTNFTTETLSGPDGSFRVSSIPVGPYVIRVSKEGFSKYEQGGIVLTVGQVATIPVTLNVGAQTQNVVVTAEAPAVESTNSTIQSVVEENVVSNLPLNGEADLPDSSVGFTNPSGLRCEFFRQSKFVRKCNIRKRHQRTPDGYGGVNGKRIQHSGTGGRSIPHVGMAG